MPALAATWLGTGAWRPRGGQSSLWSPVGGSDWRPGWVGSSTFFPYSLGPPWTLCPVLGCGVARGTLLCPREMSSGFLDFGRNTGLSCNFKSWFLLRLKMQFCAGALIEAGPSVPRATPPPPDGAHRGPAGAHLLRPPSQSQPPVAALLHFSFWPQAGPLSLTRQGPRDC